MLHHKKAVNTVQQPTQSNKDTDSVDQLWYTWSDKGLDTIRAGFRIRAASEGLHDLRDSRVQNLNRYQHYSLPRGVDPAIDLALAPVCLALINTGEERILMQKVYTGRDAVGRYGVFFVHLVAALPESFSALNAIALWKDTFWQRSDETLDRRTTVLPPASLTGPPQPSEKPPYKTLPRKTVCENLPPNGKNVATLREHLPYLIEAYLTKRPVTERWQKETLQVPQKLYIAGLDDDIALLIYGLTSCLPQPLIKDLTFSTFEHDVTEAETEIVGTCWSKKPDPQAAQLLPEDYYREKLAMNLYVDNLRSPLHPPLVEDKPLARQFALHVTKYLIRECTEENAKRFRKLLRKKQSDLTIDKFLISYDSIVIKGENSIKSLLLSTDYRFIAEELSDVENREELVDLALYEPDEWRGAGRKMIITLREKNGRLPSVQQILVSIAQIAVNQAVASLSGKISGAPSFQSSAGTVITPFETMVDMISCAAPPNEYQDIWRRLRDELLKIRNVSTLLRAYWPTYVALMTSWAKFLPPPRNIRELRPLLSITWERLGPFLELHLPLDWTEEAVKELVSQYPSHLSKLTAESLAQSSHPLLEELMQQLIQDSRRWPTAQGLFERLADKNYPYKMGLFFILMDSAIGQHGNDGFRLQLTAHLKTTEERVQFLVRYGPTYLPLQNALAQSILDMFRWLANHQFQRQKMQVLFAWLEAPSMQTWFADSRQGETNLAHVFRAAQLNVQEIGEFFQRQGQTYITQYPQSSVLISLFYQYAQTGAELRIKYVSLWLDQQLDQQTLERVLDAAHLTLADRFSFLEHYGEKYLAHYPQSSVLTGYIQEFFHTLQTATIDIFLTSTSSDQPSVAQRILQLIYKANLPSTPMQLVKDWWLVGAFVRKPSYFKSDGERIASSIGRLVSNNRMSENMQVGLLSRLASAYLEYERVLANAIPTLRKYFTWPNLGFLLDELAESARNGIHERRYARTLYINCIFFVLSLRPAFTDESEQDSLVDLFLDTLLYNVDEQTFAWLNTQAKKWSRPLVMEWQSYVERRQSLPHVPKASRFEKIELWWERELAFTQMRQALRSRNPVHIAQVATEYKTTLMSYKQDISDESQAKIDEAVEIVNTSEETIWKQYDAQQLTATGFGRREDAAFAQIQQALESGRVGKIVNAVTDQMLVLQQHRAKVPGEWWVLMDAAFEFFLACEDADEETDEAKETAIIVACNKIENLTSQGYAAPRLTLHEKKRKEAARYYSASQARGTLRQWQPATWSPLTAQPEKTMMQTSPPTTDKTRSGWLAKFLEK